MWLSLTDRVTIQFNAQAETPLKVKGNIIHDYTKDTGTIQDYPIKPRYTFILLFENSKHVAN